MKRLIFIIAALFATAQSQTIQTIGAPTTTVVSRGNFRTDSIFYLPKRQKLPTDSGAVRYQISDSSVYYWTGSNWRRLGVHIDTAAMLLPYLRAADTTAMLSPYLKESDTVWLSNRINLKVNIADTSSMLNPYLRGSGTANYFPKFDASRSVINSELYESGTNLLFNTTVPSFTSAGITTIENNATSSAVYTYKIADTIRAYMGYGGSNTFDINNLKDGDIRFYTSATLRGRFQTDGTFRLNSLTGTGSRIVVADANGVLSATSSATGLVDTTVLSTRAWRQKGDDSLGAIIATKGSGTVTSVATGYGLSGGTITTTGTIIVDSAIVASRLRVGKVVDSLALVKQNVLTNPVTGTGTTNYVPKFAGTSTISNSVIVESGNDVAITGAANPASQLFRVGNLRTANGFSGVYLVGDATYTDYASRFLRRDAGADAETELGHRGKGALVIQAQDSGSIQLRTIATTRATITTIGNIGVNITNPDSYSTAANRFVVGSTTAQSGLTIVTPTNADGSVFFADGTIGNDAFRGYLQYIHANDAMRFGTDATERARINSSGELLLNTTTDAGDYKLQVSGNAYVTGTTVLAATSGNVGVGTASPSYKLHIEGASNSDLAWIGNTTNNARIIFSDGNSGSLASKPRVGAFANDLLFWTEATGNTASERLRITQSGIVSVNSNTPDASAQLSVTSTTRGFLPPRMTTTQRDAISSPAAGLVIYNTTTSKLQVYTTSWTDLH